jgi:hypothetical protein
MSLFATEVAPQLRRDSSALFERNFPEFDENLATVAAQ